MRIELAEGAKHDLVLEISDGEFSDEPPDAGLSWAATEQAWSGVQQALDELPARLRVRVAGDRGRGGRRSA
jgi:hypothetical protein